MKLYDGYDRVDLTQYMVNDGKLPDMLGADLHGRREPIQREEWWWGEQMDAIRYYTDPDHISILLTVQDNSYDGEFYSILHFDNGLGDDYNITRFILLKDSFGSGSGADLIMGCNGFQGYGYVHDILMENSIQFLNLKDLVEYVESDDGYNFFCERDIRYEFDRVLHMYIRQQDEYNYLQEKRVKVTAHHITGGEDFTRMRLDAKYYKGLFK